jgi:hypothetical protein
LLFREWSMALIAKLRGKVIRSIAHRGLVGTILYAPTYVCDVLSDLTPARRLQRRRQAERKLETQREFDRIYHVDTAGRIGLEELRVLGNRDTGVYYLGTDPDTFRSAISSLPIQHETYTFVDYGSGKGKALLLATEWPFKACIGVEFAPAFHCVAESNFRTYVNPAQRCRDLRSVNTDAAKFDPPPGPLVLYFFNPFMEPILSAVLKRIGDSLEHSPRDIWVVYSAPYARSFDESPLFDLVATVRSSRGYRTRVGDQ